MKKEEGEKTTPQKNKSTKTQKVDKSAPTAPVENKAKEEAGEKKITAMQFFNLNKVHKLHKRFVEKTYTNSEKKTAKEWETEFRTQKVID